MNVIIIRSNYCIQSAYAVTQLLIADFSVFLTKGEKKGKLDWEKFAQQSAAKVNFDASDAF